jgi:hypothetical protein
MEITGLNDFIVWMYDKDGNVITDPNAGGFPYDGDKGKVYTQTGHEEIKGLFKVDLQSSLGATQANITGLAPSVSRVYGSNYVAEVNTGTEQPSIALAANDIPHAVYDLLTGLSKDTQNAGGYARQGKAGAVNGGVIAHSYNTHKNIDLYFAFPFGVFIPGELKMATNTQNPTVAHDALTLNAQARSTDTLLYEKFYSDEPSFDFDQMIQFITGATPAATSSTTSSTTPATTSSTTSSTTQGA